MTAPTPPIIPSTSIDRRGPSAMVPPIHWPSHATPVSIQSIGYCPRAKVVWNMMNRIRKKMGNPTYLFDSTLSIMCVVR